MARNPLKQGRPPKPVVTETNEQGCLLVVSHKPNKDGYIRMTIDNSQIFYHRYVWLKAGNEIPEGYEIDHICRNRSCCNVAHLQILERSSHKAKTNVERSTNRISRAREYWIKHQCTGTKLAELFGCTQSCGCRWIREWKEQIKHGI